MDFLIYGMIFLGSALMVFNIGGFLRFARQLRARERWEQRNAILYFPIGLLVAFLLGYLGVGFFGKPDLLVSGILFGGSVFVYVMYRFLTNITRHIAERERLEAELLAAEESSRSKTAFLSSISHEMRTPLNVILGQDTVALKEPALAPAVRDHLEKIGLSARHLLELINGVLDLNAIEDRELEVRDQPFVLGDAVAQVNVLARAMCEKKGLTYRCDAPEEEGCRRGDAPLLKKVLLALLDNAVKFTDAPGTVSLTVRREEGDWLSFAVRDTGVGVGESFLPKIFDVFAREDSSSTTRHGGSGLGLAVTKRTVELLGGEITAASRKDQGSVFTVRLPLPPAELPIPEPAETQALDSLEGVRILIVEDIPENAEIAMDLLELEGAESEHAENGLIGLEMFRDSAPGYYDAILMDLRMPVMDGLTSAREIRKLDRPDAKTVPILALTANALESDMEQTAAAGMNAHLAKPTDADLLYEALKTTIGSARAIHARE